LSIDSSLLPAPQDFSLDPPEARDCASDASNEGCRDIEGMYAFGETSAAKTCTAKAHVVVVAAVPAENGNRVLSCREPDAGEAPASETCTVKADVVAAVVPSEGAARPKAEQKASKKSVRRHYDQAAWDELKNRGSKASVAGSAAPTAQQRCGTPVPTGARVSVGRTVASAEKSALPSKALRPSDRELLRGGVALFGSGAAYDKRPLRPKGRPIAQPSALADWSKLPVRPAASGRELPRSMLGEV
jgi:hypothetical protein